ncbi:hypothetical protein AMTRI_Chr08g168270 [Amborella trichopoda]
MASIGIKPVTPESRRKPLQPRNTQVNLTPIIAGKQNGDHRPRSATEVFQIVWDKENRLVGGSAVDKKFDESTVGICPKTKSQGERDGNIFSGKGTDGIASLGIRGKENCQIDSKKLGASLAEELEAIREKMVRLSLERERTEELLRERELVLERKREEMDERVRFQEKAETEVKRLQILKQLRSLVNNFPLDSLREIEQQKKSNNQAPLQVKVEESLEEKKKEISENESAEAGKVMREN